MSVFDELEAQGDIIDATGPLPVEKEARAEQIVKDTFFIIRLDKYESIKHKYESIKQKALVAIGVTL